VCRRGVAQAQTACHAHGRFRQFKNIVLDRGLGSNERGVVGVFNVSIKVSGNRGGKGVCGAGCGLLLFTDQGDASESSGATRARGCR
jgi:hypothetical protein